ncbi:unnamed protein product [Schistocephalus solidus]|uniref:Uncharacterized protein n=1 Tax=Schistocephalus solidus TaxID=70667 RepID=A0A183T5J5_SCHSO|nr:unnamed protein product [Schistocephalus solidus]
MPTPNKQRNMEEGIPNPGGGLWAGQNAYLAAFLEMSSLNAEDILIFEIADTAAKMSPLNLAAWNVRSLLDNPRSNRSERRTALVARELAYYKEEIAALSETRFSEQGQLEEVGAGYTFFWSGRPKAERRDAGFAFAIRNDMV